MLYVVLNQLCSSLWTSCFLFLVLYTLANLISFLEIQRLQLAGSSSTVFAANLILSINFDDFVSVVIHVRRLTLPSH